MKKPDLEKIIDGKAVSKKVLEEVSEKVKSFSEGNRPPCLTVVIVGENPASQVYVGMKVKAAARCGIESRLIEMPADTPEESLLDRVERLNSDPSVDGILVQLPLPGRIDEQKVIEAIDPVKDVDGFHPYNLGRLAAGKPRFIACTPLGITVLLSEYGVETEGKQAVVIGRSVIVGRPMSMLLGSKSAYGNATVTVCHSRTPDLAGTVRTADILIAAAGSPMMVKGDMVKEGVVVIDVGTNRVDDPAAKRGYRIVGDVDFESVYPRASLITPVPGGVGPMTVAMLMKNTLQAAVLARGEGNDDQ